MSGSFDPEDDLHAFDIKDRPIMAIPLNFEHYVITGIGVSSAKPKWQKIGRDYLYKIDNVVG